MYDEQSALLNNGSRRAGNNTGHNDGYGTAPSSPECSRGSQSYYLDPAILPSTPPPRMATIDTACRSPVAAMAAAEVIINDRKLHRRGSSSLLYRMSSSTVTHNDSSRPIDAAIPKPPLGAKDPSILSLTDNDDDEPGGEAADQKKFNVDNDESTSTVRSIFEASSTMVHRATSQLPAVAIASILNFMIGIPFGASYFPTELPLPGKEVLGLRMFLFSTMAAQLVFTFKSNFTNGVGLQMVENVPFCLQLARTVIEEQGTGTGASSTLFFLFGLSSVIVGLVFYLLGRLELGRVVYFFPSHVLVGCIGGIGAFIAVTSLEVTTNTTFSFTAEGFHECIVRNTHLLGPVVAFELVLRLLMRLTEKNGVAKFPLLGPIYYCCITPVFYAVLWVVGISIDSADEAGFFFPPLSSSGSAFGTDLLRIFTEVHADSICWKAVMKSVPTMISLTAFSLIHVPINIPAFAISTNVEPDMNAELIAHGYSNAFAGIFGGLQNYMAYSNSVIYSKSSGSGKVSSLGIVAVTVMIYIYGPTMASYVPRCMAGTLLLHVGIDLFLEGVVESYHDYDRLEYSGIWLITVVMVIFGMDAALVAGVIAALSTYTAQSIVYQDPIRGAMSGARLRSSAWNRCYESQKILLDDQIGRQRIYIIQLQGHIFFGNVTKMTDDIKRSLYEKQKVGDEAAVVILDFTHVLGLDSSAAQSIAKLKSFLLKNFDVEILLFVTGHADGFRCTYNLSKSVADKSETSPIRILERQPIELGHSLSATAERAACASIRSKSSLIAEIPNSRLCETLDDALIFAEDVMIALQDPSILRTDSKESFPHIRMKSENRNKVKSFLETLCPGASESDIDALYALLSPEKYHRGETVWKQGDVSESMKLVIDGSLISSLDDEHGALETVCPGSAIGELGLVNGIHRLTTIKVLSDEAILYSLSKQKWELLTRDNPRIARFIDVLVIRYLAHRVQHVSSSNILDRRSLPV